MQIFSPLGGGAGEGKPRCLTWLDQHIASAFPLAPGIRESADMPLSFATLTVAFCKEKGLSALRLFPADVPDY
jgi:hypothetical protein